MFSLESDRAFNDNICEELGREELQLRMDSSKKKKKKQKIDLNSSPIPDEYSSELGFETSSDDSSTNNSKRIDKGKRKIDDDDYKSLDFDLNVPLGTDASAGPSVVVEERIEEEMQLRLEREEILLREKERIQRQRKVAQSVAIQFAHPNLSEDNQQQQQQKQVIKRKKLLDSQTPFALAMEEVKTWKLSKNAKNNNNNCNYYNNNNNQKKRKKGRDYVPKLVDLSMDLLAKNADAIVSIEHVPDELRHRLSKLVCDYRKMDARFVQLLAKGSQTKIRVRDMSQLSEEEFTKIFCCHETIKNLTVLQLDLCGHCMPDYVLCNTLGKSLARLPALSTLSLRGAHRVSDKGLVVVVKSAPLLQSINLSQCSLLTSGGIIDLARRLKCTLKELYLDDCLNIDAMLILPALKKIKHLEVLSVANIQTVTDDFVVGMAVKRGRNMKELVFANCVELTDKSLKVVGKTCPQLRALDLSYLSKLTDSALQYLANGCRSICSLSLCHNDFSDEAIAAFLEASGGSLNILALNSINRVSFYTASSIAKSLKSLLSLDLSWCRKLTEEALGLIVNQCPSLKLLKLFGCTQVSDFFLKGISNSELHIIGCKMSPILKHLDVLEPQEAALKYSPLTSFSYQQYLDPSDT